MLELLFRSRFRWRLRLRSVTGDAAYGTRKNITAVEKAGIRAYVALPEQGKRTSLFTIDAFAYDAERDVYTCPEARSCVVRATTTGEGTLGTQPRRPPATPVPSRANARTVRRGAG